ncbi:conserved hypothetical protein [Hyphomicrobiales bacterium]|nr:conserved hypothetical protein [Hyphomicrobiales bacterium]
MSREEVVDELKRLARLSEDGDPELAHSEADKIISDFVKSLGYSDVANAFDEIFKWYA